MELYPLTVVLIRTQADGGIPCNLGFGGNCQVGLRRLSYASSASWFVEAAVPCETHQREYNELTRSNSEQVRKATR